MKKFLKFLFSSVCLFTVLLFVTHFVFATIEKNIFNKKASEGKRLAIVGHSHARLSIDDKIISKKTGLSCKNYGIHGQSAFWSIIGARKLCKQVTDYVIIELSNTSYTTHWKTFVDKRAINEIHKKYFLDFEDWMMLANKNLGLTIRLFTNQILPRTRVRGRYEKSSRIFNNKLVAENAKSNSKLKIDFDDQIIHDLVETYPNVKFIIIRAPQHPGFYNIISEEQELAFVKAFNKFETYSNCIVKDFGHLYTNDDFFGDLGHMNSTGAKEFSLDLSSFLVNNHIH